MPGVRSATVITLVCALGFAVVQAQGQIQFTNGPQLPGAVVNQPYGITLGATGGTAPYTFSLASGQLPAGLTLGASGLLSGVPLAAGSSSFSILVKDSRPAASGGPGSATGAFSLAVIAPPVLTRLVPDGADAGSPELSLAVQGSGFTAGAGLEWNGQRLNTFVDSATQARAVIPAALLGSAGTVSILMRTATGVASNALPFVIRAPAPPVISRLDPASVLAGQPAFQLNIFGSGFSTGSTAIWNGTLRLATVVETPAWIVANVPASALLAPGVATVVVQNAAGVSSSPAEFLINSPRPQILSLSPSTATAGSAAFTLNVSGSGFVRGAVLRWNTTDLATNYVSLTQVTAAVPATLLASPGLASLVVINPDRQTSAPQSFQVTSAPPSLSALTPSRVQAGAAALTLSVSGANFQGGASLRWNGSTLNTTFISASQLSALVPASLLMSAGTASITAANPDGLSSGALTFTIEAAGPQVTSLEPSSTLAGSPAFSLLVTGNNFRSGSAVRWNGVALPTNLVSATQLSATVAGELVTAQGTANVTVANPDGQTSGALGFTIGAAPSPQISSLSPVSATAGGPAFTLLVNGSNFRNGAIVRWNGTPLTTSFGSALQLSASVPAALIASGGSAGISVLNPDGQSSQAVSFAVSSPAPQISALSPPSATAGGPAFVLTVSGASFQSGASVRWNGSALSTTFVSANQLSATVTSPLIASPSSAAITVSNPDGQTSLSSPFNITSPGPLVSSLSPSSATAGGTAFSLAVTGVNFLSGAVVQWNATTLATTFISPAQLSANVPASLIVNPGSASITVSNPDGQISPQVSFLVSAQAPVISGLTPNTAVAGGAAFVVAVTGANFRSGAAVQWNGSGLVTTFLSATQLTASVPAALIANAGTASVTVLNPDGQTSPPANFPVTAPVPLISSISPSNAISGGPAFSLAVTGSNFRANAVVQWNGSPLTTVFVSAAQLTATVPAGLIANAGQATVTVVSDGQSSGPAVFTITAAAPQLTLLNPSGAVAGSAAFVLTATGANFRTGAAVLWNGAALATTFVSATQLAANVPAALIAAPGSASVTVANADGQTSGALPFTIGSPAPLISGLSPSSAPAGGGPVNLAVTGANFNAASVIRWNGTALESAFVSAAQLSATVPAALLAAAGSANVSVRNADGQESGAAVFTISVPGPQITSLSPSSTQAGGSGFTLTVNGVNFQSGAYVRWNVAMLNTGFVSATQLTAEVPAGLIASAGQTAVVVVNADGQTSPSAQFTITPSAPPQISTLSPASAVSGSAAFTLTVNGAGFRSGAAVRWNGSSLATVFVSNSQLTATVPASLIETPGAASVSVLNPDQQSSAQVNFQIAAPAPRITSLGQTSAFAGAAGFTLAVQGSNFIQGAVVRWNGAPLTTTFGNAGQLSALVPAALLAAPVVASLTVVNPDGQASAALNFTVELAPRPEIVSLSPNSAQARGAAFVLTVQGRNFQSGAAVRWNGTALNTTFLSATQVTADVAASLLATPGAASIVVANPDGQATAPASFTIAARPPRITSVSPNSVQATGPAFALRITGSDFAGTATVRWNSTALATTFVSESELTANVPASLILSPGAVSLLVTNGDGQSSEPAAFTVSAAPAPTISALSPNTAQAAGAAFTLTVDGANFQNGAVVRWNGSALATTFVSATRLTAAVSADLIASAAAPAVVVANPDGQTSAAVSFSITAAPAPRISSLDPAAARAGDPAFAMTILGVNFQSGAIVRWNGSPVPTVFVSSTRLSASIGAALIAAAGQSPVTVVNPDGQISAAFNFRVNALAPRILSFVPTSIQAAGPSFTLVVQGADFQSGAVVRWNGAPVTTSFDSAEQLSASIPAALIQNPGTAAIAVLNPDGQTSAPVNFSIGAAPAPLLTSLSPSTAQAGSAAFTLAVNGSNFQPGAVVRWNGSPLTTLQSAATQLTASVPAELIATAGPVPVTVQNPDGQTSTAASFVVTMTPPRITTLSPASATAGGAAFTLTVQGSGFQSGAAVLWSGAALNTTFVSASQLTAVAPASLIAQAATIQVAVRNPDNQTSNESAFSVGQALRPTISSVNPASVTAGLPSQVFTVNGANFRSGAVVSWGGTQLATTFVSASQVTALATGPLLATPASVALTLRNSDGQTSDAFAVNVTSPAPLVSLLAPASAPAGSPEFTLRIAGQNFRPGMEARWNATALPTVVNSATEIAAIVGASLLATPGSAAVTVSTSDGAVSAALPFTILNPVPQLLSVSPSSVAAGSAALRLTIAGDRFVQGAQVLFNGNALATSFVAANQLTVQVPADLLARPGNAAIAVRNPENQTSNSLRFTITEVAVPEISRLNPSSAAANGPAFALSVSGFNFLNGADVLWNGAVLQTTFVSPTQLTANVPATLLTAQGQSAITVRNPSGQTSQPAAFEIGPPLLITTAAELEDAAVGRAVKVEFAASGGARPYRWAVAAGSTLPEGLTLDGAGVLQGTPLAPADAQFEIEVRDSVNAVDRRRFRLKILPRLLEILSRSPLPRGTAGVPYSFPFELSESNLPDLVWSLLDGELPAGLSVNPATGELAGVPVEPEAGDATPLAARFRIQAVSGERTAVKEFDLTVAPAVTGLSMATPATLPDGQVGRPYQGRIAAVGGRPPYNYAVTAGSLPSGIQFSAAGSLDGTPQQVGAFSFTVEASDAAGRTATRQYSLRITALPPVQITSGPVLPVAIPAQPYSFLLNATGGRAPYRWILLSGGLPPGLTFDPRAGRIAGTPQREGVFRFLIQVTEAGGASDRRELQIPVALSGDDPVRFTTGALPQATLGSVYRAPLAALGGLPPYRFTVAAGLPEGLRLEGDAIAGAPVQPGAFRVLITVTDSRGSRADREYALVVSMAALSAATIGGIPETLNPGQQSQLLVELASPYPVDIAGRLEAEFVSAGAMSPGDPALQFSTGGRTVDFRIPAGQTRAVFPQTPFGVQTGTVAGSLVFRLTFRAAGQELRPANTPDKTILIPQTAPVISSATLNRTAGGFDLIVSGFSPTREVIEGVVTLNPAAGREIQSTRVTIPLGTAFQTWFANTASQAFGSQFRMVLPFTGDASSIDSLTVVLRNAQGSSNEVRAAF